MAKTHEGDCTDIDPFIPTGQCSICTGLPQDTVIPEERPGGEFAVEAPPLTPEEAAVPLPEEPPADQPAEDPEAATEAPVPSEPTVIITNGNEP